MWNVTKEAQERFLKCNLLPIQESAHDWEIVLREAAEEGEDLTARLKEELDEVREELMEVVPSRFHPYVEDGTLNQPTLPKSVREDYLQWMRTADREFEKVLDEASKQTEKAVHHLPQAVQEVFAESLHDSQIQRIERVGDNIHLYLNTDGGFSTKALIHFQFKNIVAEESEMPIEVGQWLVYDELQQRDEGFAFRVLFDGPSSEWTIFMKELDAEYFYRPSLYVKWSNEGMLEESSLLDFLSQVDSEYRYWLITPDVTCRIHIDADKIVLENGQLELIENQMLVKLGEDCFTYDLTEYNPMEFIYTDVYEDPYEHFHKSVPTAELEEAALCEDLELQVRAWNTMYAKPEELADIINTVLMKMTITEENEMMLSVYCQHFYTVGILTEVVIEKYRSLLD